MNNLDNQPGPETRLGHDVAKDIAWRQHGSGALDALLRAQGCMDGIAAKVIEAANHAGAAEPEMHESHEGSISPELATEILNNSIVIAHGWFEGDITPDGPKYRGRNRFNIVAANNLERVVGDSFLRPIAPRIDGDKNDRLGRVYGLLTDLNTDLNTDHGVDEFVTLYASLPKNGEHAAQLLTGHSEGGVPVERAVMLRYEVASRALEGGESIPFQDGHGRPGNYRTVDVWMDKDAANRLMGEGQDNPQALRSFMDRLQIESIGMDEKTIMEDNRPPYEEWRELHGGVSRMAFIESRGESGISEPKVVEF